MSNLRALAVSDMKNSNQSDYGLPVVLTAPDGTTYNTDAVTGETLTAVQILYDRKEIDPTTGAPIIIPEPIVVMARQSLARVPQAGENWHIRFPPDPYDPDTMDDFALSSARSVEGGRSIGFIRLYPLKATQS